MDKNEKQAMGYGIVMGIMVGLAAMFVITQLYKPLALLPTSPLNANTQLTNAQIYKYVNVSDLRVNSKFFYPENCSNYQTVYTENNATTPAYISAVILGNNNASEGFISVPYIINGSVYEFHYEVICK